jgi:RNA polymerase sigma-70 factor (ECF subfamily)
MGVAERSEPPAAGHPAGLEQVYLDNRPALLRFLRARGAGEAAEDLLQELWIKASAGAAGPIRDSLSYLYRTANNLMLDRRRAEIRQVRREVEYAGPGNGGEPASEAPHEERAMIAREELRTAQEALSALGERTEAVFRRFRLEGASQKQIAEEEGISLSAVEKHLQKAYRALIQLRSRFDAG